MKISPISVYSTNNRKLLRKNDNSTKLNSNMQSNNYTQHFYMPLSFKAVTYNEFNSEYSAQKDALRQEMEIFSRNAKNVTSLGKGVFSEAFYFDKYPNIVVKKSFNKSETFELEGQNLQRVMKFINNTQRFVGRAYDDTERCYYLLSTKVDGDSPNPQSNPWTRDHLRVMFNTLFEMDKNGFYHADLNNGNMKLQKNGNVNFLDYQWSSTTPQYKFFDENPKINLPPFIAVENSQMFEMAEIPYYVKLANNSEQSKSFLREYLQEKANYHANRYNFLSSITQKWNYSNEMPIIKEALIFELAQSRVLQNPSELVLRIEAKKIQMLGAFREAYKHIDANMIDKNIIPAGAAFVVALSAAQDFKNELYKLNIGLNTTDMHNYLEGQIRYANFWLEGLTENVQAGFGFPSRHTSGNIEAWETVHNFYNPNVNISDFGAMTNISGCIDPNYKPKYSRSFSIKTDSEIKTKVGVVDYEVGSLLASYRSERSHEIRDKLKELSDIRDKLNKALNSNWGLDVMNLSLLGTLRARELQSVMMRNRDISEYQSSDLEKAVDMANKFYQISLKSFETIYAEMQQDNKALRIMGRLSGYENMGNFA